MPCTPKERKSSPGSHGLGSGRDLGATHWACCSPHCEEPHRSAPITHVLTSSTASRKSSHSCSGSPLPYRFSLLCFLNFPGMGLLGGSVVECLPLAQVVIPESWDQVPHWAPCSEPASPSAYVSASLCVSREKIKS